MKLTRAQSAWILYDMANAAFALIVRTVFAPMFFLAISADVVDGGRATSMLLYAASIAGLAAGVLSPWLGAIADARGGRKRYLGFFLTVGAAATLGFCLAGPGDVWPVLALYFIGLVAYMGANSFYDSLLVDVAPRGAYHRLSSAAYAWGYVGGMIPFVVALAGMFLLRDRPLTGMKGAFVLAALWWCALSVPLFRNVRERRRVPGVRVGLLDGFRRLAATAREIGNYRNAVIFLIAYFLYIDGVGTIFMAATPISLGIGITPEWLLGTILALQLIGCPFTILYGRLSRRIPARKLIYAAIGVYLTISLLVGMLPLLPDPRQKLTVFLVAAFLIGTSQGGIQSLSRSLFSRLIPRERSSEFFGFYNIFGKFTTVLGPVLVGIAVKYSGRSEYGILLLAIPFLAGGWLLSRVNIPPEGKTAGKGE